MPSGSDSGRVSKATFSAPPRCLAEHPARARGATLIFACTRGKCWHATCSVRSAHSLHAMPPRAYHEAVWEALPGRPRAERLAGPQALPARPRAGRAARARPRLRRRAVRRRAAARRRGRAGRRRRARSRCAAPRAAHPALELSLIACEGDVGAARRGLRRGLGRGGDRARRRHRRLAVGGAPRAAPGRHAAAQHPRPSAAAASGARAGAGCVGAPSRPPRRAPALLHPPLAGGRC